MKNIKLLILIVLGFISSNLLVNAQTRVIDNKGTVSTIDASKWTRIGVSNDIYAKYPGNVGIGGITTPQATLHNAGSIILGITAVSNIAATYSMPVAFVDQYSGVIVAQTSSASTITLLAPTSTTAGRLFSISNASTSTYPLTISGTTYTITPGQSGQFVWNGTTWSLPGAVASSASAIAGDVSGTLANTIVDKIKGQALSISSLATNDMLKYDGTNWVNWIPTFPTLTSFTAVTPLTYNNGTGVFSINKATTAVDGYLSSVDWNTFNNKVSSVTAASTKVNIAGTATAPTVDVNVGNLGAITLATGTTGTDVNVTGSPANLGGTLTLNIPDASATARGVVTIAAQTFEGIKTFNKNITAPTATNTINGLVVNAGALSAVTGYAQASGNFVQSGAGTFSTGTGAVALNGATALNDNATLAGGKSLTFTGATSGTATLIPATTITNYTLTLPAAAPTVNGQVLSGTTAGALSWVTGNSGTVTNFSAGNLSPLFTTIATTTTTTPALSFALTNAGANTIFGNNTGAAAAPAYFAASALPIAGDVSGTLASASVDKIKGQPLLISSLATNDMLKYNGTNWVNSSTVAASTVPFNGLTAATNTNTIDNTNWAQTWNWSTATTQNPLALSGAALTTGTLLGLSANALTTGSGLSVTSSSNVNTSTNGLLYIANTGATTTGTVARIQANNTAGAGLTVLANGNVGVGTVAPTSKLEVNGAATNTTAYNGGSSTTIDFTLSNLAYTTANAGAIALTGLKNGGTYTLAVQGTTVGTASFSQSGLTFKSTNNGPTASGYQTIYTFIVMGTTVYFWMNSGF